jgi:rSAM/selenodomain-associated transferase 2
MALRNPHPLRTNFRVDCPPVPPDASSLRRQLSVVIPTLNEQAALPSTLDWTLSALRNPTTEILVSDCGSSDETPQLALGRGVRVVLAGTSRATALNLGARAASGQALLFIHADSKLPVGFDEMVLRALDKPDVVGGAFDFNWASHPLSKGVNRELLRLVRVLNRIRFRWTGNFYGDQGIFVLREVFERLGRFPEVRLMEDLRFCRKLKQVGRTAVLNPAIKTSPRRFVTRGVLRQLTCDLTLLARESTGLSAESAWESYNALNASARYRTQKNGATETPRSHRAASLAASTSRSGQDGVQLPELSRVKHE